VSALETRGLYALPREEAVDCIAVHTQHPAHAHGIEPPVVNQAPNGFRMNAELVGDVTDADETVWLLRR